MSNLISIITPTYNSRQYIKATYDSLLGQTYSNWEWLVVDDCSDDDTVNLIREITFDDERVRVYVNEINSGAAVSRNRAIELAHGRFIAFLDSDDLWMPTKLECQTEFMVHNNIAFSYSAYQKIDEKGVVFGEIRVPKKVEYTDLLKVSSIGCLTAIYDAHVLGKVYMPLIRKRQDLGLWLKILKMIPYAYSTPGFLAQYRVHPNSISANKRIAAKYTWMLYRDIEALSLVKAIYYFSHYAVNGILRTKFPSLGHFLGVIK